MKQIKCIVCAIALLNAALGFGEAKPGNCTEQAMELTLGSFEKSEQVSLVNEWDPDIEEFYDSGVYYFSIFVTKGSECTVWITGNDTPNLWLDVDTDIWDDTAPSALFETYDSRDENLQAMVLKKEAWADDDNSGTYYIAISGEIGQRCTLHYQEGVVPFVQEGEEEHPKPFKFTTDVTKLTVQFIESAYWFSSDLKSGCQYSIRTVGGSKDSPLNLSVTSPSQDYEIETDPNYADDLYNASYLIRPNKEETFKFCMSSASAESGSIKFRVFPSRLPKDHDVVMMTEDVKTGAFSAKGVPGREIQGHASDGKSYYDNVIDEFLAAIDLLQGERWIFETSGATGDVEMRVYDENGDVLGVNGSLGKGSKNARVALEAPRDGRYYVGVCVPGLKPVDERPTGPEVTVIARSAADFGDCDNWDPTDDTMEGASLLTAVPEYVDFDVISLAAHGPHQLNGGDWYDWFALPCRAGISYILQAGYDSEAKTDLTLNAEVFRLEDGKLKKVEGVSGSLTPPLDGSSLNPLTFTAAAGGVYYICVSVAEGIGLDFPPYNVRSVAFKDGEDLGLLEVVTEGMDGDWYLTGDKSAVYPSGAILAVEVGNGYAVRIVDSDPAEFVAPGKIEGIDVGKCTREDPYVQKSARFVDVHDKKSPNDDTLSGKCSIAIGRDGPCLRRTFWKDDPADYFQLIATEGCYYSIELEDTTDADRFGRPGDAVFTLYEKDGGKVVAEKAVSFRKQKLSGGAKYVLKVEHLDDSDRTESCYNLLCSSVNAGAVALESKEVVVLDSAAYVDVKVSRTSSEGAIRLNFSTEPLTAEAGKDYYPTNGIISWADGEMDSRTVRVRLIPELLAKYEAQRKFKVAFWPMPEDCIGQKEYPAVISGQSFVTVKIRPAVAQNPGKVVMSAPESRTVLAGTVAQVRFSRLGGSDGAIAVKVKTQTSTAVIGTNSGDGSDLKYVKEVLTWADGDSADKVLEVPIWSAKDVGEIGQFRLKLATLATGSYEGNLVPEVPESKIYVSIENDIKPGTVVMTSSRSVNAGETYKAVFSRVGGSSGKIAVKVKTQTSTAVIGTSSGDGSDLKYVKEVLTWDDGDAADKVVEVPTWPVTKWSGTKQFRFKLATLATGEYAGNLTPALEESKIYVSLVNRCVPAGDVGGPVAKVTGGVDADGNPICPGKRIELVQGVYTWLTFGSESGEPAASFEVVDGQIPPGLVGKGNKLKINGVPSEPGDYSVLVQVSGAKKKGTGIWLDFHVAPAGTALGSFSGVLKETGKAIDEGLYGLGSFMCTVAADGTQYAKIKIGANTYVFNKDKGYDAVQSRNDSLPGQTMVLQSDLEQVVAVGSETRTNRLSLTVGSGTNAVALGESAGRICLTATVIGANGTWEDVKYAGELFRNCSDYPEFKSAMQDYVGYYTVALVPEHPDFTDGTPAGNGYVTLQVAEDGLVTGAGLYADGSALSFSARGSIIGAIETEGDRMLLVPMFHKSSTHCFGGILKIVEGEGENGEKASYVDSSLAWALEWNKDEPDVGLSFRKVIRPTGGWFNTIVNLQRYYLNRDFSVDLEPVDRLPKEFLPAGCTYGIDTLPHDVQVLFEGNAMVPEPISYVYRKDIPKALDFDQSSNPWKVRVAFNRETGVLNGTFKAWNDTRVPAQFMTFSHYGVLPMFRDAKSPLELNVFTAGFCLMPVSDGRSTSLPFNIKFVEHVGGRDWSEPDVPDAE